MNNTVTSNRSIIVSITNSSWKLFKAIVNAIALHNMVFEHNFPQPMDGQVMDGPGFLLIPDL